MGKMDYLDALKRAMLGLPPDVQARTLAYYEQRFVDGVAAGSTEQEVGAGLDDPTRIAMTLRASAHLSDLSALSTPEAPRATPASGGFDGRRHPADALRLAVSAVGLAIFNLFMIVPAIVYGALLFAVYVSALACYLGGVATAASGLAGTSEIVIDVPSRFIENGYGARRQFHVDFTEHGIDISPEPDAGQGADDSADDAGARDAAGAAEAVESAQADIDRDANAEASANAFAERAADDGHDDGDRAARRTDAETGGRAHPVSPRRGVHTLDDGSVRISTGMDAESRTGQTVFGIGLVLGGTALFLLALAVTRLSLAGLRRYLQMNLALLRGNGH